MVTILAPFFDSNYSAVGNAMVEDTRGVVRSWAVIIYANAERGCCLEDGFLEFATRAALSHKGRAVV